MPSFTTTDNHYVYYYHRWIQKGQEQNFFNDTTTTISSFVRTSGIIVLSFMVMMSWNYLLDYRHGHYPQNYDDYHLEWIMDIIKILCFIICIHFILTVLYMTHGTLFDNLSYQIIINIDHKLITKYIMSIIGLTIICSIPTIFRNRLINIYIINKNNSSLCKYIDCINYFSLYQYYLFVLLPGLSPFIIYIFYVIYLSINNRCTKSQRISKMENEMALLDNMSASKSYVEWAKTEIQSQQNSPRQRKESKIHRTNIIFLIMYFLTIGITRIESNLRISNNSSYHSLILIQYIFCIFILKQFMKQLSRKIDKLRLKNSNYEYFVSVEYLMEWIFSIFYWSWYRVFVVYKLQNNGKQFVEILMIHFVSEIFESNIKFTNLYFQTASKCLLILHDKAYFIWRHFEDNSDKKEWRRRLSMDLICRFYASLLTGIFEICYVLLSIKENKWQLSSIMYLIISIFIEFIHYIFTFYIVTKSTTYKFIVSNAFMDYISTMTRFNLFVIMLIYFAFFVFAFLY